MRFGAESSAHGSASIADTESFPASSLRAREVQVGSLASGALAGTSALGCAAAVVGGSGNDTATSLATATSDGDAPAPPICTIPPLAVIRAGESSVAAQAEDNLTERAERKEQVASFCKGRPKQRKRRNNTGSAAGHLAPAAAAPTKQSESALGELEA